MTVSFNQPQAQVFDANGNPGVGFKYYFYEPGTLTPKDVYSDADLMTPVSQPVTADAAGRFARLYMSAALYRVILKDASGVTKVDADNYDPGLAAGFGVSSVVGVAQGGTGASNAAAARANLGAASSSALTDAQNTITENSALIATGLHADGDRFGEMAALDEVSRDEMQAGVGDFRIQRVKHTTVANASISVSTPALDTSKPQISEGTQVFTKSFTPLSDSSTIRVRVFLTGDHASSNGDLVFALFKDSDADAIAADAITMGTGSAAYQGILEYEVASGSTSARTYSVRAGMSSGSFTINGSNHLGSLRVSYILIEEWVTV